MELHETFPERHRRAMADPADPIHNACDFFLPHSDEETLDLPGVNQWVHGEEFWAPWPSFLIAFASQGCGDYFAYDTRSTPSPVVYLGPDGEPEEELSADDALRFDGFDAWYEYIIADRH